MFAAGGMVQANFPAAASELNASSSLKKLRLPLRLTRNWRHHECRLGNLLARQRDLVELSVHVEASGGLDQNLGSAHE
jgi:hypothetical protein